MTEWRHIDAFAAHLRRCGVIDGEVVAVLSESQSRPALVETSRLAAQSLGGRVFDVVIPTPSSAHSVPIRSTGASQAIAGKSGSHRRVVVGRDGDRLHCGRTPAAPELGAILDGGAPSADDLQRAPDIFERLGLG